MTKNSTYLASKPRYEILDGLLLSRMFSDKQSGKAERTGADGGRKVLSLEKFRVRGGFWWCALAIIVLLSVPRLGGADMEQLWKNGLYEAFVILACFPLIVALGAGIFILAVFVAYASLKLYDLPVREWLKRKLFKQYLL